MSAQTSTPYGATGTHDSVDSPAKPDAATNFGNRNLKICLSLVAITGVIVLSIFGISALVAAQNRANAVNNSHNPRRNDPNKTNGNSNDSNNQKKSQSEADSRNRDLFARVQKRTEEEKALALQTKLASGLAVKLDDGFVLHMDKPLGIETVFGDIPHGIVTIDDNLIHKATRDKPKVAKRLLNVIKHHLPSLKDAMQAMAAQNTTHQLTPEQREEINSITDEDSDNLRQGVIAALEAGRSENFNAAVELGVSGKGNLRLGPEAGGSDSDVDAFLTRSSTSEQFTLSSDDHEFQARMKLCQGDIAVQSALCSFAKIACFKRFGLMKQFPLEETAEEFIERWWKLHFPYALEEFYPYNDEDLAAEVPYAEDPHKTKILRETRAAVRIQLDTLIAAVLSGNPDVLKAVVEHAIPELDRVMAAAAAGWLGGEK